MLSSKLSKIIFKYKLNINKKSKKFVLLCCRGNFDIAIKICLIAKILNDKYNLNPIILYTHNQNSEILKIYKSFGIKKIIKIDIKKIYTKTFFKTVFNTFSKIFFLIFNNLNNFVNKFSINRVIFGDLIYDSYLRNKEDFYYPNKFEFNFIFNIYKTFYIYNFLSNLIKHNNIKRVIVSQFAYSNISTIMAKISLNKKIKTSLLSGPNFFNIKKSDEFLHPYRVDKKILNEIRFTKKNLKTYKKHLKKRHSGKLWHQPDNINAYKNKKKITVEALKRKLNIKSSTKFKQIILYACHAFKDAPHSTGPMLFTDYYDALLQTINHAKKDEKILWIFKEHPSAYVFGEENYLQKFFKEEKINNYKNIKICPNNIKTTSIIEIADKIVTSTSSLGLEAAAFYGKRPILSGNGYYSKLGFSKDCKSKKEYFESISDYNFKNKLNKKNIQDANKVIFFIECSLNQTNFGNIFVNQRHKRGNKYIYLKEKKYSEIVYDNFMNNNLFKDPYYKYLLNKVTNI